MGVSAPGVPVVVSLDVKQHSVIELVPELYVEAGAQDDPEELQHAQTQAYGTQDYQVVLRRFQELVYAAL